MKKFASILVVLVLVLALCVPTMAEEKELLKIGQISMLSMSEEESNALSDSFANAPDNDNPRYDIYDYEIVNFPSLSEMLMALDAGQIQWLKADEPTVQYILSRNEAYQEMHPVEQLQLDYAMLFMEDDAALCDSFNAAIAAMKEDGTLDALAEKYIDGVIAGAELEAADFPELEDADTITVAVTGDLPPMDYVDDAGYAAGFSTSVLAEIAHRLGVNIHLIHADSGARALALSSGRADVAFWVSSYANVAEDLPGNDIPEGTIASEPYYSAPMCCLALKAE